MSAAPVIKSDQHAFLAGAMLCMLMKVSEDGVLPLRPEALMDHHGSYTNVIELRDPDDNTLKFTITLDQVA